MKRTPKGRPVVFLGMTGHEVVPALLQEIEEQVLVMVDQADRPEYLPGLMLVGVDQIAALYGGNARIEFVWPQPEKTIEQQIWGTAPEVYSRVHAALAVARVELAADKFIETVEELTNQSDKSES